MFLLNRNTVAPIKRHVPFYFFARHIKNLLRPKELEYLYLSRIGSKYDVFIDVGANLGYYSYLFSRFNADVYSFEPNKELYEYISYMLDKRVKVFNSAVSSENGKGVLYIPRYENTSGRSSLIKDNVESYSSELVSENVNAVSLNVVFNEDEYERIFIKIDVEGFENEVIKGCERLFSSRKMVDFMIEIDPEYNSDWRYIFDFMSENNYETFYYNGKSMIKLKKINNVEDIKLIQKKHKVKKVDNFFFSKDDL